VRYVVYTDQVYKSVDGALWTDRTFPLFVAEVGRSLDRLTILGRVREDVEAAPFRMPDGVDFVALPRYDSLVDLRELVRGSLASIRAFWRQLDEVDGAWIMGPHPIGLLFAVLTLVRRRRLVLGVRQEFSAYARRRHPKRRVIHLAADLLEHSWRALARVSSVVVVGPELRRQYAGARRLHELRVSLMRASDIVGPEVERARDYEAPMVLSVGRLEEEKNPLMLADVLAGLRAGGRPWRMVICGKGAAEDALRTRLAELGVADAAELKGYVPIDGGLRELYREADAFLHVSWTEGVPQVLFESFAARSPTVATDVGGVRSVAEGAALLIGPGDPDAAVAALERIADDPDLRRRITERGAAITSAHTFEAEAGKAAAFLAG
jgi:glycosyltransferase involved in cell wall biosynthesis